MTRASWTVAISALALAACAGTPEPDTTAASAAPQAAPAPAETTTSGYTDTQLRAYAAAHAEIAPITSSFGTLSPEQRTQATTQIRTIQQRHGIDATTYDAIETRAAADEALANRIGAVQLGSLSDAQVQAFARASLEIDPINRTLATATPEQRAQAGAQIRAILQRNNLDGATYNAIAAQAQTNSELAARIAAAQTAAPAATPQPGAPEQPGE